jgi:hypothetical protein
VLTGQPGIDPNWLRYDFEAISILTNFGATIGAMLLTSLLEKVDPQERAKIDTFFERLSTPVDREKTHAKVTGEVFSPFYIIAWITAGTGLLLIVASVVQPSLVGRVVNIVSGAVLGLLALGFSRLHKRFMNREETAAEAARVSLIESETEVAS